MPGKPYLEWPLEEIAKMLYGKKKIVFIPFAAITFSFEEYTKAVNDSLERVGLNVIGIHTKSNMKEAINEAEAIMVGGGNTFSLLNLLYKHDLLTIIRQKTKSGTPYIGWSAGSNVAGPTIKTTNDMPIEQPPSFDALQLIDIQINPHYTELTIDGHGGESRTQRLKEYLCVNSTPVVCLPEGYGLKCLDGRWELIGEQSIKLLKPENLEEYISPGPMRPDLISCL